MTHDSFGMRRLVSTSLACAALIGGAATAWAQNVEPILQNGPDSAKKIIAVIGDGYAAADMAQYAADVQEFVIDGVFTQDDNFHKFHTAFNVYRIDAISNESGVSQIDYDEHGTTSDASDDTIISQTTKDTALGYVYSGSWAHCWMQSGPTTSTKLANLLAATVPNADYTIIILNEAGFGGCGGGGRVVVTSGGSWTVVGHEMGHGIGALHDEYTRPRAYMGAAYNARNCSTDTNRNTNVWGDLIDPATPVPTTFDSATMDSNYTVGIFPGCKTYDSGIYRPVNNCRMRGNSPQFCPVCARLIEEILEPFVDTATDYQTFVNWPGAMCKATSDDPLTYSSDATIRNNEATPVTISCPGVRPNKNGWANHLAGHVFVIDRHPSEDVCCHVESRNPGGANVPGTTTCSEGSSSTYQVLKLDFPKVRDPYTFSHFHVDCTIPGTSAGVASRLMTYRIITQRY